MPRKKKKEDQVEKTEGAPQQMAFKEDRFLHYLNTFKGYKDKIATQTGHLRQARKACKAEGIDPALIDEAMKLERGDPNDFRNYYEGLGHMLRATDAPFQLKIFDTRFGEPVEQAKAEARATFKAGATMDCRWPEGSEEADAYVAEYQRLTEEHVSGAGKEAPQLEAVH